MGPRLLFLGSLRREFILPPEAPPALDIPGGEVLYAAVGAALWGAEVGLVSRVGEDFPRAWLEDWARRGWDVRGVRILPQALDLRRVVIYEPGFRVSGMPPARAFVQRGLPFPKALLGYEPPPPRKMSRERLTETTLRMSDLPPDLDEVRGAHFTPHDWVTHTLLPAALRQAGVSVITLDPAEGYMDPDWSEHIPMLLQGLTAFLPAEEELRRLFAHRIMDLWEMAEALATWGVEYIVIKRGAAGHSLYERSSGWWSSVSARCRPWMCCPACPNRGWRCCGAGCVGCEQGFLG